MFIAGLAAIGAGAVGAIPGPNDRPSVDQLPVIEQLPDPFLMLDGSRVKTREDWARRREELKALILYYEYGHMPPAPGNIEATEVSSAVSETLGGTEKQLTLSMGPDRKVQFRLDLTIPTGRTGRMPVIIRGDLCWKKVGPEIAKEAMKRGYILAEFDRTQIAPDKNDRTIGAYPLYPEYDWGAEAAWAWGFHRVVDYLLTLPIVDGQHIAATGHSRGGKAALLAGALDERIGLVAPNGSGAGGAAPYRIVHPKGETMARITTSFPFWFHPRLRTFVEKETRLPFDHHEIRALVAPRAHLSAEAMGDLWANPTGNQQAYLAARVVYEWLGAGDRIGIHYREGKHAQNEEDWSALMDFADKVFFGKTVTRKFDQLPFPDEPKSFTWTAPAAGK
jgi:dienelactone hydrolase